MQMYVEHWIPAQVRHPYPVVLIHGGFGQGSDWFSTPDGRRGWATLFLEQGYKVYVLDRPGQGRNPYQPFVHGAFAAQAPTFEAASRTLNLPVSDPRVAQAVAPMGQPMPNNAQTQSVWRIARGDAARRHRPFDPGDRWRRRGVCTGNRGRASGAGQRSRRRRPARGHCLQGVHHYATSREPESLPPVLAWLDRTFPRGARRGRADPHPNRESTALKLADQGCFWVGVQRKQMPYGTIAQGQMFVQYMIPAEKRHPLPVVMVHGGGGQGTHMMGIGGRPGWVHYFVQAGYSVYWLDRPSYGRSPYHPDALGPSHLPNVPALRRTRSPALRCSTPRSGPDRAA